MEYCSAIRKGEILSFVTWMELESIMLSEISQRKTRTVRLYLYVKSKQKSNIYVCVYIYIYVDKRIGGYQKWEVQRWEKLVNAVIRYKLPVIK